MKHQIVIHENTGATKESAPYLGSYIAKETVKEPSFAAAVGQKCGMSAIQVRAILDGSFQAIEELESAGLVRVHTDIGIVHALVTGSFPTADATPDPVKNKLNLCLRLTDDIRLALVNETPAILADESLTKLRVDNVMDVTVGKPYNLIHGRGVFRVAGFNMVLDDEGAAAYLLDRHGVTYPLTVDEVVSKQLFKAHLADLLEAGDYKLVVKSRAGDAEGPLQTAFRKVKYLRVLPPPPTVTKIASEGKDGIVKGEAFAVVGTNLRYNEGDSVKVRWEEDGEAKEETLEPTEVTPEKMSFDAVAAFDTAPDNTELTFELTIDETR